MTYKTRKHIWPVALMSLAVFGLLAAAVALTVSPTQPAQAHGCDTGTIQERAQCDTEHENAGLDSTDPTHEHDANQDPVATGSLPDLSLRISMAHGPIDVTGQFEDADGDDLAYSAMSDNPNVADAVVPSGMMTVTAGSTRGTARITVTADDGHGGTAQLSFNVVVAEAYRLTADPGMDPMLPPPPMTGDDPYSVLRRIDHSAVFVVDPLGNYDANFDLGVAGSPDDVTVTITATEVSAGIQIHDSDGLIGAGFVDAEETDLEGSLTVKATDQGSRAFDIEGICEEEGAWAHIVVEDKDLDQVTEGAIYCKAEEVVVPDDVRTEGDPWSIASYNDWEFMSTVTDGYINTDDSGVVHMVNQMHMETGWLERDEPVVSTYQLGRSDTEQLTQRHNPEMGQNTIEVLVGAPHVQITVTADEEGPAYVRFLDSDMEAFGLDIDEVYAERGADVVGLDSHGRLPMGDTVTLSDAKALAYDQYDVVVPGNPSANARLVGRGGAYYQDTFRFFDPCPAAYGEGHHFYVQVWSDDGKYLEATEKVTCINPDPLRPSALTVTTFSDRVGVAILRWNPALGASTHHVLVADATTLQIVPGTYQEVDDRNEYEFTGLSANVAYIFAVVGERGPDDFSQASFIIQEMTWASAQ